MFEILRKSFEIGVVTTRYPLVPPEVSPRARGRPELDFPNWKDARAATAACPTGALACRDSEGVRTATLDLGKCIFCGLCAEADAAIRMTPESEVAARRRTDLTCSASYGFNSDGTHKSH